MWEWVFDTLTRDRDNAYLMLDSTIMRASTGGHRKRGDRNQALGRSRGGLTTKVRIACDTLGRPLRAILSPGQAGDAPQALALMEGFRPRHVLADAAYDANTIRNRIADIGARAVIPCNPRRKHPISDDAAIYKHRNRIERFFNKLKHFLAFFHIAAAIIWMRGWPILHRAFSYQARSHPVATVSVVRARRVAAAAAEPAS